MLIDKARLEAEEAQRLVVSALNGLAAVAAIHADCPWQGPPPSGAGSEAACVTCAEGRMRAVEIYREALGCVEENASEFRADPLQKLHTLHNLACHLGLVPSSHAPACAPPPRSEGSPTAGHQGSAASRGPPSAPEAVTCPQKESAPGYEWAQDLRECKRRRTGRQSHRATRPDKDGAPAEAGVGAPPAEGGPGSTGGASGESVVHNTSEHEYGSSPPVKAFPVGGGGATDPGPVLDEARGQEPGQGLEKSSVPEGVRLELPAKEEVWGESASASAGKQRQAFGLQPGPGRGALAPPRTLRDELLLKQCADIRETYLLSFQARLASARKEFEECHKQVHNPSASSCGPTTTEHPILCCLSARVLPLCLTADEPPW